MRQKNLSYFIKNNEWSSALMENIEADASNRKYTRLKKNNKSVILMDAPPEYENISSFIEVANILKKLGLSSPEIIAYDTYNGFGLIEDFGENTFNQLIDKGLNQETLYKNAIDVVIFLLNNSNNIKNTKLGHFNDEQIYKELEIFLNWAFPSIMGYIPKEHVREEFLRSWKKIIPYFNYSLNSIILFDFHADNLMWLPERKGIKRVGLLDFQDAVYGPSIYDLVSLLEDSRRIISQGLKERMIDYYINKTRINREKFELSYSAIAAQRNLRIIGVFCRLLVRDSKQNYLKFLPTVWSFLESNLNHPKLIDLKKWFEDNIPLSKRKFSNPSEFFFIKKN